MFKETNRKEGKESESQKLNVIQERHVKAPKSKVYYTISVQSICSRKPPEMEFQFLTTACLFLRSLLIEGSYFHDLAHNLNLNKCRLSSTLQFFQYVDGRHAAERWLLFQPVLGRSSC